MEKELYAEMADLEERHWWFLGRRAIILDTITRFCGPGRFLLLDIGLGTGINASKFSKMGFEVEGVEPSDEGIAFVRAKAPNIKIIHSPFPSPEVPNRTYQVVALLDVLEHFDDDNGALRGITSALKDDGIAVITVPAFPFLWTYHDLLAHHKRRYRKTELKRRLEEAGLEPIFLSYYNFFLFPLIALVRLVLRALGVKKKTSDFSATPSFLNTPLSLLFGFEKYLLRLTPLPWGVSLIAVAKKKSSL